MAVSKTAWMFNDAQGSPRRWSRHSATERRNMLADILAKISSDALQGDSLEGVLKRIVDCVIQRLPVTLASIILLNDSNTHFVEEVWSGTIDLELPGDLPWPVELGAAGRCVRLRRAQLIADVAADPDYVPGNSQVCSEYLVPIQHLGRIHGVLNLESTSPDFFTPDVCAAFDAVAEQIAGAVHLAMVVRELETANRKLHLLSMRDGLTDIANRRCFDARLATAWSAHARIGASMALLLVDVDCFKELNDTHGHLYGDECLRTLARHCAEMAAHKDDLVARFGGEEFACLLPNCGLPDARRLAENLRRSIAALGIEHPTSPVANHLTVSIGVSAVQPLADCSSDALIDRADRALYKAKRKGRNCVVARSARLPRSA